MAVSSASILRPFRLLVIEHHDEDALAIEKALQPEMVLHRATSLGLAGSMLREQLFEAILVNRDLPLEKEGALLVFIRNIALEVPVVVYTANDDTEIAIETMKAGASDCIRKTKDQQHLSCLPAALEGAVARNHSRQQERKRLYFMEQARMMETLRATVAKVTHDINNPLAIISGNAQLLIELGRFMKLDDEIIKPIQDIEEASSRIAASLYKLSDLKDMVKHEMAQGDGSFLELDEEVTPASAGLMLPGTRSQTRA